MEAASDDLMPLHAPSPVLGAGRDSHDRPAARGMTCIEPPPWRGPKQLALTVTSPGGDARGPLPRRDHHAHLPSLHPPSRARAGPDGGVWAKPSACASAPAQCGKGLGHRGSPAGGTGPLARRVAGRVVASLLAMENAPGRGGDVGAAEGHRGRATRVPRSPVEADGRRSSGCVVQRPGHPGGRAYPRFRGRRLRAGEAPGFSTSKASTNATVDQGEPAPEGVGLDPARDARRPKMKLVIAGPAATSTVASNRGGAGLCGRGGPRRHLRSGRRLAAEPSYRAAPSPLAGLVPPDTFGLLRGRRAQASGWRRRAEARARPRCGHRRDRTSCRSRGGAAADDVPRRGPAGRVGRRPARLGVARAVIEDVEQDRLTRT